MPNLNQRLISLFTLFILCITTPATAGLTFNGTIGGAPYAGGACYDGTDQYGLLQCECGVSDSMMTDGSRYPYCTGYTYSDGVDCQVEGTSTYSPYDDNPWDTRSGHAYCMDRDNVYWGGGPCSACTCGNPGSYTTDWYQYTNANSYARDYVTLDEHVEDYYGVNWACSEHRTREYGCAAGYYVSDQSGVDVECTKCPNIPSTETSSQSCSVTNGSGTQSMSRSCSQPSTNAIGSGGASSCTATGSKSCGSWSYGTCCATSCNTGYSVSNCQCVPNTYSCSAGKYLNGTTCATCEGGYYCPGGSWTYNGGIQGRYGCPSSYPNSDSGTSNECYCYTSCSGLTGYSVSGRNYYCATDTCSYSCNTPCTSVNSTVTQSCSAGCSASCSVSCGTNAACPSGYTCTYNSDTCSGTKYGTMWGTQPCTSKFTSSGCYSGGDACSGCTSWGTCGNYGSCGSYGECSAKSSSCTCSIKTQTCNTLCTSVKNTSSTSSGTESCTRSCSIANGTCSYSGSYRTYKDCCNGNYTNNACSSAGAPCSGCSSWTRCETGECQGGTISISCNAGYYLSNGACVKCEAGYYCTGDNARRPCSNKPSNSAYTSATGNTSSSCPWSCNPGYYGSSAAGHTSCADCGSGNYCTGGTHRASCASTLPSSAPTPISIASLSDAGWSDLEHCTNAQSCICEWYFSDSTRTQYLNQSACMYGPAGENYTRYYWCRTGYYAADPLNFNDWYSSCKACTNGPANSYYTSYSTPSTMYAVESNCPWCCNANHYQSGSSCVACNVSFTDTQTITGGTRSRTCYHTTSSACSTSSSACTGTANCSDWEYDCSAGYYLSGTTCEICTNSYYCPGDNKRYDCPDPYTYAPASYPANYYSPTISSVEYAGGNGNTSPDDCRKLYWFDSTRGGFYEYIPYSSSTGRYVTTGYIGWYIAKPGYYLKDKYGCGYYAYYSTPEVCPSGSYCSGKEGVVCNSSNQSTVWTETFGLEPCPSSHPYSASGNNSKNTCYTSCPSKTGYTLTGGVDYYDATDTCTYSANTYTCSAGKYLNGTTCTACESGYYCPGGTWTYNGGIQGRNTCPSPTDSAFTSLYSWSSDGIWDDVYSCWASGSTTNDSGTIKLVCMASDTNGTYKDACRTNGGTTCNPGYYFDGIAHRGSFEAVVSGSCQLVPAGKYFAGGEITDFNTAQVPATCPSAYPNSAAGSDAESDCYTTVTRGCTQNNGSIPSGCASVSEWNACSCTGGTYVKYSNGTTSGTTSNETCLKTAKTVLASKNHYVHGATCPSCSSADNGTYVYSDGGDISWALCYKNATLTGAQTPCSQPTTSASYTCGTCSPSECSYRDYAGTTDTTCTPTNCEQPVASVVCNTGYYTDGTACPACTNAPSNSTYTGTATSNACPWSCNDGYNQTSDNQCAQFCTAGITHLHLSGGISVPLYTASRTSPSIHVKWNNTVCYGSLAAGTGSGLNVKQPDGSLYHAIN